MGNLVKWTLATAMASSAFGLTYAAAPNASVTQAQAASVYYAQANHINIRSSASTKSKVVGQYKKNSKVTVIKSYNSKWYQVSYKGVKRYVYKSYVKKTPVALANGIVKTGGPVLYIRAGASTKYKAIGSYKNGQIIAITNYQNPKWYQVVYKGKIGYVSSQYIQGPFDAL
ncbi:SH3 domain-containing protein [Kurthia senegalensis]|uniref:SH3 domain-containing protein n=1 Tax=Kurthia senegalensis TaxID=1033740 RepID=UPI000288C381|nr:SH3 domain-containing protein [Kurthia senegalensis]